MVVKKIIKKLVPDFIVQCYHFKMAFLGALWFGFPSRKLKVIGVTGTNGKSTTVLMIVRILEEAGFKVGSVSSMWYKIAEMEKPNPWHMTMPGRFVLQKLLRQMVKAGCQYAVIEATSEGVLQSRHKFINWQTMALTNLSEEHIEHHGSFEKYREAKGKLFRATKGTHIINSNDENAEYFLQFPAIQKFTYGLGIFNFQFPISKQFSNSNFQIIKAENTREEKEGLYFIIQGLDFHLPLIGEFNVYNALAAIAVARSEDIPLEVCQRALLKIKQVSGRMEEVVSQPFKVIVDLAHTLPAVEQVYQTAKKMVGEQSKIISVFGSAGGGRDKWKRPKLGELAAKYCDVIILTNEDPYDENALQIIKDIKEGIFNVKAQKSNFKTLEILDRKEAIRKALEMAKPGDVVLLLGKGTEATMVFANGEKIPWNEQEVAKEEFQKLGLHF